MGKQDLKNRGLSRKSTGTALASTTLGEEKSAARVLDPSNKKISRGQRSASGRGGKGSLAFGGRGGGKGFKVCHRESESLQGVSQAKSLTGTISNLGGGRSGADGASLRKLKRGGRCRYKCR